MRQYDGTLEPFTLPLGTTYQLLGTTIITYTTEERSETSQDAQAGSTDSDNLRLRALASTRTKASKARTGDSYLVPLPYPLGWFEV